MSYTGDHLAWQQRVASEMNAHRRYAFLIFIIFRLIDKMLVTNNGNLPPGMFEALNT